MHFINVVIPIKKILDLKGENWWKEYLKKNDRLVGDILWFDNFLLRDGAMDEVSIEHIIEFWAEQGFEPKKIINGKEHWNDLCVVDSIDGPTLPCEWLNVEYATNKQKIPIVSYVAYCDDISTDVVGPNKP